MNKSESIKTLATSLASFQAEVTNPKNSANNPFFKSKYAPLNEILNDVRPILSKFGLSIIQFPSGEGKSIGITTLIMHTSGEWIESDTLNLEAEKATPQSLGSAITYARRYSLSAILGISSEDDDDGNIATHGSNAPSSDKKPPAPSKAEVAKPNSQLIADIQKISELVSPLVDAGERDKVSDAIKKHHKNANFNSIKELEVAKKVIAELEKLKAEVNK